MGAVGPHPRDTRRGAAAVGAPDVPPVQLVWTYGPVPTPRHCPVARRALIGPEESTMIARLARRTADERDDEAADRADAEAARDRARALGAGQSSAQLRQLWEQAARACQDAADEREAAAADRRAAASDRTASSAARQQEAVERAEQGAG